MLTNRMKAAQEAQELHRQNIQRSLQHRLQVARTTGDERLIRQLEAEMKSFG